MPLVQVQDTGNGAAITFSSTTFAVPIKSISGTKWEIEKLNVSALSTTDFHKHIAGDLKTAEDVTYEFYWDTGKDMPTIGGASETITVTFPLRSGAGGEGTAATLAGTGFIKAIEFPQLANGEVQMGKVTVCFDGATGPAFTKSVTA